MPELFVLLVVYQVKHFLADYPLQGSYMLRKFLPGWDFVLPLAAHAGVHAGFTFCIVCVWTSDLSMALVLAPFDFAVHFTMDRLKAGPKYLGRYKALSAREYSASTESERRGNKLFWWSLGLDQMVHHLTHYAIIFFIMRA